MSETTSQSQPPGRDLIGSYFIDLWRYTSETLARKPEHDFEEEEEDREESPTELDTLNSSAGFSVVGLDKLSLLYPNAHMHGHDVGVVQANRPAPSKRLIYYFEIYVTNAGAKGQISIGFTTPAFKLRRQPGWEANSYGYHGDDGLLYRGNGKGGETFGPTYTTGDTVGGGINYATQELFFTKNGVLVGSVYKDVKGPVFPTVAVHSQNEEVIVNFGKNPFVFDIKAFESEQRAKQQLKADSIVIPPDASYGIVRSYLQHYGYEETLKMLDNEAKSRLPPISENSCNEEDIMYALDHRRTLRQLIKSGKIDEAFSTLREWYPQIVQDHTSTICFLLHCQKFIELVRDGKFNEAVVYGRSEFDKFKGFDDLVKDCAALLTLRQASQSSVGYLLQESQRELVADALNAVILSTNPNMKDGSLCMQSGLERLIRQITACFLEKRSFDGDQGESFKLSRVLNSGKKG